MLNVGLYGKGMDQFVRDEAELGTRVACSLSQEEVDPLGWLVDIFYAREMQPNSSPYPVTQLAREHE